MKKIILALSICLIGLTMTTSCKESTTIHSIEEINTATTTSIIGTWVWHENETTIILDITDETILVHEYNGNKCGITLENYCMVQDNGAKLYLTNGNEVRKLSVDMKNGKLILNGYTFIKDVNNESKNDLNKFVKENF